MPKERGGIKKVGDLFDKYRKNLIAPEASVISVFVEVVDDLFGIRVPKERVRYKTNTKVISLTGRGPLKSEIQLHKKEILIHLKGRLGGKNTPSNIL